jgi:hypothetical protein
VVSRFDQIVERGHVYGPYTSGYTDGFTRKPRWLWLSKGDAAHDVLDLFAPWLSARRRAQALEHGVVLPRR